MTESNLTDDIDRIKKRIAQATDLQKLLKNNTFLESLKKLPQLKQLEIFQQYKDQFLKISENPKLQISQWTQGIMKELSTKTNASDILGQSIQQGQHILENLRESLK